jgi:arylsulfatase A-like enzyme
MNLGRAIAVTAAILASFPGCRRDDSLVRLPDGSLAAPSAELLPLDRWPGIYTAHRHRDGETTHGGILLRAGEPAEWSVTLPEGADFSARVALSESSSAATQVRLVVRADDTVEAGRITVKSHEPTRWSVPLERWQGRTVSLRLELDAAAKPVFLGSPIIEGFLRVKPRRVVVLAVDTLRPDHLGTYGYARTTSPELDAWANGSVVFERAWSPAPRTRPSFRTSTTGQFPLGAVGARSIGDVFDANGFATAGIVANAHLNPRFTFDEGYDLWWLDPRAQANTQVDRALAWLEENRERDTFLFLHIMDPHLPYVAPSGYNSRFVEEADPELPDVFNRGQVYRWDKRAKNSAIRREHVEARYDGEIAWTSHEIGRFLDGLADLPGTPLLVFHTDHGEEFWEHGAYEHNHTLYDELVRTALWFQVAGTSPRRIDFPASLADIAPTLYDYLGFPNTPEVDGISLRPWMDGGSLSAPVRDLPVGFLRYDKQRWGVIVAGHKYVVFTGDGREELYDLRADPGEQNNLVPVTPDRDRFRAALAAVHDMPVGPGWRVQLHALPNGEPITLVLPVPCESAALLDPQALVRRPVNQEWGEVPDKTVPDIGQITISDDRREVRFTPGPKPDGILAIVYPNPPPLEGTVRWGDSERALAAVSDQRATWSEGGVRLTFTAGTILIPPPDEAERMAEVARRHGAPQADEVELLKSLGDLGEDEP